MLDNNKVEIWRDVENTKGLYQVSDKGRVRSLQSDKKHVLRTKITPIGYEQVGFFIDGKRTYHYVHRLVAETFLPNYHNKETVNHLNEDKLDNRVENLCWMSRKENCNYGSRNKKIVESRSWYKHSLKTRKKISKNRSKAVLQYTKKGVFVAEYTSTVDAAKSLKKSGYGQNSASIINMAVGIAAASRGAVNSLYGYIWFYKEDLKNIEFMINSINSITN